MGSLWGCVMTQPGAKDTGVSAQHLVTVVGWFVWYREEAEPAIMTTARTFLGSFFFLFLPYVYL